jgi:hypothetical protein
VSMGEPQARRRESMESISASSLSLLCASIFVSFLSPSASSLIQSFSVVLNLHHLLSLIVSSIVLTQDALAIFRSRSYKKTA